jgi:UDP-N-acetylmuramoylalanine--D-glutamate ligase
MAAVAAPMTAYAGRRVSVVGLGREGLSVTRFLAGQGARVLVSDAREADALAQPIAALSGLDVMLSLGGHREDEVLDCDLLVLSPGVDKRSPLVQEALRRGIAISSETELFLERCPARVVGITGSAGKTTTTTLAGLMLQEGFQGTERRVYVGGNIGRPLIEQVGEMTARDWVVLELSSFQLEWLLRSPHVAVITNISPNHLDRHGTMASYVQAKANIVAQQSAADVAILNADDEGVTAFAACTSGRVLYFSLDGPRRRAADGAYLRAGRLVLTLDGRSAEICEESALRISGRHNIANALAAAAVAGVCGVAVQDIGAVLTRFGGVAHRLQLVATVDGVAYYDDSIATSPERTLAALAAIERPVVLILGGRDKHLPWEGLARTATRRARAVVLIGEAADLIASAFEQALDDCPSRLLQRPNMVRAPSMAAAVAQAHHLARPGDAVLLAPGCASYDMYRDFEERGDDFVREVRRLEGDG